MLDLDIAIGNIILVKVSFWSDGSFVANWLNWRTHSHRVQALAIDSFNKTVCCFLAHRIGTATCDHEVIIHLLKSRLFLSFFALAAAHDMQTTSLRLLYYLIGDSFLFKSVICISWYLNNCIWMRLSEHHTWCAWSLLVETYNKWLGIFGIHKL